MEVRVLGPVEAIDDGGLRIDLRPKERLLLARLAAGRRMTVADDVLIDCLWNPPPSSARKTLQGLVHHLRRSLGEDAIVREPTGYRLASVGVDLDLVQQQADAARREVGVGHRDSARRMLRDAKDLFRGDPFPELENDTSSRGLRRQLAELHLTISEDLFELDLACGGNDGLVGELEVLVGTDPTRERAWCLLASALASTGRQADALNAVSRARRALALELGVEPGPQLRELEQQVLEHRVPQVAATPILLGRRSPSPVPGPLVQRDDDVPFVGRRDELGALRQSFTDIVRTASLQMHLVIGEAGIGKTRLAAQHAARCHDDNALVLFGRSSEFVGSAFEPLQQALHHVARADSDTTADPEVSDRLLALLDRMSADRSTASLDTTPAAERHRLFEDLASAFELLARDRPVLMVLDDLHWASRPTIMALSHLLRRAPTAQLMVLATARAPEYGGADVVGTLGTEPGVRVMRLRGLDVDGVREYLATVGVDQDKSERSASHLHARTGGNLFMLGQLATSGVDAIGSGQDVPELVRDVIAARARRLPAPALDLLQMASIAGLEFDLELLVRASGSTETDVVEALDAALDAQLIVEQPSRRVMYAFPHALTRDALAAGLTKARQTVIHRQLAVAIEDSPITATALTLGRLAYHYLRCNDVAARTRGLHYAEQAGERSMSAFAYEDAIAWFNAAIDALGDLPDDLDVASRLNLALAHAATLSGDEPRARRAAAEAWRIARATGNRSRAASAALLHAGEPELNVVGDEPGAIMLAATLDFDELTDGERARVMARLGSALSYIDHERAVVLATQSLTLARDRCSAADLAFAMRCRLRGWFDPGRVDERIAMAEQLTAIGQDLDDGVTEAWGWRWQAITKFEHGDTGAIEIACLRLAALAERLHLPNQRWSATYRLAATRAFQGRFAEAEALAEAATEHSELVDNMLIAGLSSEVSGQLQWLRGNGSLLPPRASRRLERDLTWLLDAPTPLTGHHHSELTSLLDADIERLEVICSMALILRQFPHAEAAAIVYARSLPYVDLVATCSPGAGMYGSMHLYAGLLAKTAGDIDAAAAHFRSAVDANMRLGALPFVAFAQHELTAVLPTSDEARRIGAQHTDLAQQLGIPWLIAGSHGTL